MVLWRSCKKSEVGSQEILDFNIDSLEFPAGPLLVCLLVQKASPGPTQHELTRLKSFQNSSLKGQSFAFQLALKRWESKLSKDWAGE